MARLSKSEFETLYRQLGYLRKQPDAPQGQGLIEQGLRSKNGHLALRCAQVIREHRLSGWEEPMQAAYFSLFTNPSNNEPGCMAKTALAEALDFADSQDPAPFLQGVDFVQKEGPKPQSDNAVGLRVRCGLALVRLRVPEALIHLANLLADPEPTARASAPAALVFHGDEAGSALLRLKLLLGDPDFDVTLRCLQAYLALDLKRGLEMAESLIQTLDTPARAELALAIAETKLPDTLDLLQKNLASAIEERHVYAAVLALVTLRSKASMELVQSLAQGEDPLRAKIAQDLLA